MVRFKAGDFAAYMNGSYYETEISPVDGRDDLFQKITSGGCLSAVSEETQDGYIPGKIVEFIDRDQLCQCIEKYRELVADDDEGYYRLIEGEES